MPVRAPRLIVGPDLIVADREFYETFTEMVTTKLKYPESGSFGYYSGYDQLLMTDEELRQHA